MTKTDWFNGHKFVPAHVGVYERDSIFCRKFSFWNGSVWLYSDDTVADAMKEDEISKLQNVKWRGLKEQA